MNDLIKVFFITLLWVIGGTGFVNGQESLRQSVGIYGKEGGILGADKRLPECNYVRPVACKTNLLFDLGSALNIELEVPIGERFSIAGEYIFPWWLWEKDQVCFQTLTGGLEGRYWLKPSYKHQDRSLGTHNPLTGWFVGLYTNLGYYDFEWKKDGYQGEFYVAAGVSAGYAQPLSRHLSLELSLGVGYLNTDYRHYHAEQYGDGSWHLVRQNSGSYQWFGPTKAKVSLVWYPQIKKGQKGGHK